MRLNSEERITYQSVRIDPRNQELDGGMRPLVPHDLSDELELNLSLRHIPKLRLLSCPPDPFCVVSLKDEVTNSYSVLARTEVVDDTSDPDFSRDIRIRYMFEQVQQIRIDIYDADCGDDDDDDDVDQLNLAEYVQRVSRQLQPRCMLFCADMI